MPSSSKIPALELRQIDGAILIQDGAMMVARHKPLPNLKSHLEIEDIRVQDMGNGFAWQYFKARFWGRYYGISLCSLEGMFHGIEWQDPRDSIVEGIEWPDNQESMEHKRIMIEDIAKSIIGYDGKRSFSWGTIWTEYNSRDGFSTSGINYK